MQVPRPSEADKAFFRSLVPEDPTVEVKPMFGNLGAFVNGNMFAGLFGSSVGVRLDDAGRSELEVLDGVGPYGPDERPMRSYLALPARWRDDPEQAAHWVARALSHVASLPAKAIKPPKAAAPKRPK
jgi:TfoX/Sxy family transcriptional regulator of competence genes